VFTRQRNHVIPANAGIQSVLEPLQVLGVVSNRWLEAVPFAERRHRRWRAPMPTTARSAVEAPKKIAGHPPKNPPQASAAASNSPSSR
jgi:hypothetical protein